jgi:kynurenine 3-monooxygenase
LYAIDPCLEERLMKHTIPIHSRMIHMKDGSSSSLQYDPHEQASPHTIPKQEKSKKGHKELTEPRSCPE